MNIYMVWLWISTWFDYEYLRC